MNKPRTNLLGLFKSHQWILFKRAHHLPTGFVVGKLFQNPQCTHNVPTGYIPLHPQCVEVLIRVVILSLVTCFGVQSLITRNKEVWEDTL